jgi:hypothetical protein
MTDEEWIALAERCEKATVPDDRLSFAIDKLLFAPRLIRGFKALAPYTASLDAITALTERELPDYHWRIQGGRKDTGWTQMSGDPRAYIKAKASRLAAHTDGKDGEAATPALALCAAFCRAMAEKEPT